MASGLSKAVIGIAIAGVAGGTLWWALRQPASVPSAGSASASASGSARSRGPRASGAEGDETDDEEADAEGQGGRAPRRAPSREEAQEARAKDIARKTGMAAADSVVDRLASSIEIDDERKEALRKLLREEREEASKIMEANTADAEERRRVLDELRQKTHSKVTALLSQEQLAAYDKLRPKRPPPGTQKAPPP